MNHEDNHCYTELTTCNSATRNFTTIIDCRFIASLESRYYAAKMDLIVQGHGAGRFYVIHNHFWSVSSHYFTPKLITNWITTALVLGRITDMHKDGRLEGV